MNHLEWLKGEIGHGTIEPGHHADVLVLHDFTGAGDYAGSTGQHSNRIVALERWPTWLYTKTSGYGYEVAAMTEEAAERIRAAFENEDHPKHHKAVEFVEAMKALHDYPLLDEEHLSEYEDGLISAALPEKMRDLLGDAASAEGWGDPDLVPIPEGVADEVGKALRDSEGGSHTPCVEQGNLVVFDDHASLKAQQILARHFRSWREAIESEIRLGIEDCPGADCGIDAIDSIAEIRRILGGCTEEPSAWQAHATLIRLLEYVRHPLHTESGVAS